MLGGFQNEKYVLESFLQSHSSVTPLQAVSVIETIAKSLRNNQDITPGVIDLSLKTLASLLKNPVIATLETLLSICEINRSFEILNVFLLATAACRALVATAVKAVQTNAVTASLSFRIFTCIIYNGELMVQRALARSLSQHDEVLRCFKVARFYCLNAAKCASAFASMTMNDTVSSKQLESESKISLYRALRLISMISNTVLTEHHTQITKNGLELEIAQSTGAALRAILFFLTTCFDVDSGKLSMMLSDVLTQLRKQKETKAENQNGSNDLHLSVFAAVHLVRLACCPIHENKQATKSAIIFARTNLATVIIPFLFKQIREECNVLLSIRIANSNVTLLESISSAVVVISELITENEFSTLMSITDYLLEQVSSSNGACAYVAICTILSIEESIRDVNPKLHRKIVSSIICNARLSFKLSSPHAETRWLMLVAEVLTPFIAVPNELQKILQESKGGDEPLIHNENSDTGRGNLDLLSKHLVWFYLENRNEYESLFKGGEPPKNDTERIIRAFEMNERNISEESYEVIAKTPVPSRCVDLSIRLNCLLPGKRATFDQIMRLLTKDYLSLSTVCAVFDTLDISMLQLSAVKLVIQRISFVVRRYKAAVIPTIIQFFSRNSSHLEQSLTKDELSKVGSILEQCMYTTQSHSCRGAALQLLHAATLFHLVSMLTAPTKQSTSINSNKILTYTCSGMRGEIEGSQARLLKWRMNQSANMIHSHSLSQMQFYLNESDYSNGAEIEKGNENSRRREASNSEDMDRQYAGSLSAAEESIWDIARMFSANSNGTDRWEGLISLQQHLNAIISMFRRNEKAKVTKT